jgi:hypothetical protein
LGVGVTRCEDAVLLIKLGEREDGRDEHHVVAFIIIVLERRMEQRIALG